MDKTMLKFRIEGYKRKAKAAVKPAIEYVHEHPTEAIGVALTVMTLGERALRDHRRQTRHNDEQRRRDRMIYDYSNKHWWTTKRDITQREHGEIDYRHKVLGQDYYDILTSMNLL